MTAIHRGGWRELAQDRRLEIAAYAAILVLAAFLRLGDLGVRGTWDADQGHDMLVLRAFVLDGRIPLLGPPTSIGGFHHGALYYFLLAPAAAVSNADPVAVTTWIALGAIAAVAVTGWLARSIAGPLAGLIAALLMAVSSSAVQESTFIWNPNLIALSSSVALAAAWRAWSTGRTGWWVVAGGAAIVTMQCHVLGVVLTPIVAGLLVADVRRRRRRGDRAGATAVVRAGLGWIALGLLSYVPLLVHEIGDPSELHAAAAFLGDGGAGISGFLGRLPIVGLRVLAWPLTGLVTAAPLVALAAAAVVIVLAVHGARRPEPGGARRPEPADGRTAVRWLALGLAWSTLALAAGASTLGSVVLGLPNDHYHAFADPIVVVLVAIGLGSLIRGGIAEPVGPSLAAEGARDARDVGVAGAVPRDEHRGVPARPLAALAATAVLVGLVGWNLSQQPPAVAPDGGWRAAEEAARRVIALTGSGPVVLSSLPTFKTDEAVRMPLEADGVDVAPAGANGVSIAGVSAAGAARVILCDELFHESIGAECGGAAEDAWLANPASGLMAGTAGGGALTDVQPTLVDRFEAAPGRWISVYRP